VGYGGDPQNGGRQIVPDAQPSSPSLPGGPDVGPTTLDEARLLLADLLERDRRRGEELTRLVATAKRVSASLDLATVLSTIVEDATTLLGATSGDMLFWERERDTLRVVAVSGLPDDMLGYELAMGVGLSSEAIRTGRTLQVEDYSTYLNRARELDRYRFGSVLCAPLLFRGEAIGAINVHTSRADRQFAPGDADLLQAFAGLAAIAVDHARRFENEVRLGRELARTNEDLLRSVSLQRRLTEQVLSGGGPAAVATELAAVLDRPVVIEDHLGRPIAGASPDAGDGWRTLIGSTERGSATGSRVSVPVRVGPELVGRLTLGHGASDPVDRALVDIASTGVALEFAKIRAALDVEQRVRGDVIHDLLTAAFASPDEIATRAARLGYVLGDLRDVFILDVGDGGMDLGAAAVERERRIVDRLGDVVSAEAPGSAVAAMDHAFVVLATPRRAGRLADPRALAERLRNAVGEVVPDGVVSAAIGDPCRTPADFAESYRLAREALEVMTRLGRRGLVIGARELGPYAVLLRATEPDALRAFALRVLRPLLPADGQGAGDLLETLRVYLDEGGVRRRAARRLFVHVNTIVYRLDRIERLLGRDLADPHDAFELTLALRILDLTDDGRPVAVRPIEAGDS
jgi:sugar diacid utilization regulator/putative methionine-R-sulfoxide reductase with GAF domain